MVSNEPNVDIRRSLLMGRGVDEMAAAAPMILRRRLHWGPVWAGVVTSLVIAFLLSSLFLGLGFTTAGTATRTLLTASFNWATGLALAIGVFAGGYLTGFVAEKTSRSEGMLDGFVVGVMTILIPLAVAGMGLIAGGVAGRTPVMTGAAGAGYAWGSFVAGVIVLALGTIGGALGYRNSEQAISHELRLARERETR
ncbi:MAG TPA: hypothetical protein V6D47_13480 [Oscillatoriaceae cyanobacterium]